MTTNAYILCRSWGINWMNLARLSWVHLLLSLNTGEDLLKFDFCCFRHNSWNVLYHNEQQAFNLIVKRPLHVNVITFIWLIWLTMAADLLITNPTSWLFLLLFWLLMIQNFVTQSKLLNNFEPWLLLCQRRLVCLNMLSLLWLVQTVLYGKSLFKHQKAHHTLEQIYCLLMNICAVFLFWCTYPISYFTKWSMVL